MRYLWIFVLLLTDEIIASNICPFVTQTPNCDCKNNDTESIFNITCTGPLIASTKDEQFFQIIANKNRREINCFSSPDWANFDYRFQDNVTESDILMINNCILENNTNLSRIAELISAGNISRLHLANTVQLNSSSINYQVFKGFPALKKLYITNNLNIRINKILLAYLPHLTDIHLYNNSLQDIPDDFFEYHSHLTVLSLGRNCLKTLTPNLFQNLSMLQQLDLSYNQLNDLAPGTFDSLINLENLQLYNNYFSWLPIYTFSKMRNLKYINLMANGLMSLLEPLFQNNQKLQLINLESNRLKTLPNGIFKKLVNLKVLNIDNNELEYLPDDIFSTTKNLITLSLNNNKLTSFGDLTFRNLEKLENLDLSWNMLDNLADSAFENRQMEAFLNTSELFSGFQEKYNEFGQKVKEHPLVSLFFNCTNLVYLFLSHNNIDKMYDDWFLLSRRNLQVLDLSHNKISELNFNSDLKHKHDFYIDFSHNKIASILPNDFTNINIESTNYLTVNIKENPIKCDCHIGNFLRYIKREMKDSVSKYLNILSDGLKCQRPEGLNGLLLIGLKTEDLHCDLPSYTFHNPVCRMQCNVRLRLVHSFNEDPDDTKHHTVESETNMGAIYQFNCADKNITTPSQEICISPNTNVELDLTNNYLTTIPLFEIQEDYDAVTKLVLSQNRISSLRGISSFRNLQILEVENEGTLLVLTKDILTEMSNMMYLRHIYLGRSLFMCNDDFFQLMNYRVFSLISNNDEIGCVDSSLQLIKPFIRHFFRFSGVGQYE